MNILAKLQAIEDFREVPDEQLQWLIDKGEIMQLGEDDHLFKPGDPIDKLLIVLEGSVTLKIQQGKQYRMAGSLSKNSITGLLPYSRADKARGYAIATLPTTVLRLHKEHFREMITHQEELTTALVHRMSSRIRQFTKFEQQNDKMMALGKLSAGLAHELNNPSAAIIRSAQSLGKRIRLLPERFQQVMKLDLNDQQVNELKAVLSRKLGGKSAGLSMLARSEKEDELIDWLEEHDIDSPEELAETLADNGFDWNELDEVAAFVSNEQLPAVLDWMDQLLVSERLVGEIEDASNRINKLIASVKGYTHMDQAPEKRPEDIHIGLESTLTMLNHKIRKTGIKVIKEYQEGMKKPNILISEMNQVWTNLIDNAIDAMESSEIKELRIKTSQDREYIYVEICDTGTGIPDEIQGQIFDPFFTTKAIGKGTGLGMEVVNHIVSDQHNGSVTFETRPGSTEFKVSLPIV